MQVLRGLAVVLLALAAIASPAEDVIRELGRLYHVFGLPTVPSDTTPVYKVPPTRGPVVTVVFQRRGELLEITGEPVQGSPAVQPLDEPLPQWSSTHDDVFVFFAAALSAAGDLDNARILLGRAEASEPMAMLAETAFRMHESRLYVRPFLSAQRYDPPEPLEDIYKSLKAIWDSGTLPEEDEDTSERMKRANILESVRLALAPNPHKKGTVEWEVYELNNSTMSLMRFGFPMDEDAPYMRVQERGLSVIPYLIPHIGDLRVTRGHNSAGGAGYGGPLLVEDLAIMLLFQLSGGHVGEEIPATREEAEEWWRSVKHLDEEQYLILHAVAPPGRRAPRLCRMLAEKYPQHLIEVYRRAALSGSGSIYGLPEILLQAQLTHQEKVKALQFGARHANAFPAIEALRKLDERLAASELTRHVRLLSPTRDATHFVAAHLAGLFEDDEVWIEMHSLLNRITPYQKWSLLYAMRVPYDRDKRAHAPGTHLLRFVDALLDDADLAVGGTWPATVQDAAADVAGRWFGLAAPDSGASEQQLSEFRARVRAAIRERIGTTE